MITQHRVPSTMNVGMAPATCVLPGHGMRQKEPMTLRSGQELVPQGGYSCQQSRWPRVGTSGTDQCQGNLWSNDLSHAQLDLWG